MRLCACDGSAEIEKMRENENNSLKVRLIILIKKKKFEKVSCRIDKIKYTVKQTGIVVLNLERLLILLAN